MKRRLVLVVLGLAVASPEATAQTPLDLFQRALVQERAEGNLSQAIALYGQVVAEAGDDRDLLAQALLQLGVCHEKLRDGEATSAYERIVWDFGDHEDLVREARSRLAVLADESVAQARASARFVASVGDDDRGYAMFPDGKRMAHSNIVTGPVSILDLGTGEDTPLTSVGIPLATVVSPDGKLVASSWLGGSANIDVHVHRTDGTRKCVIADPELGRIEPYDWSPDGRYIAGVLRRDNRTSSIALLDTEDETLRQLKSVEWQRPDHLSFSNDGRFIVYDMNQEQDSSKSDLFILSVDGSYDARLLAQPSHEFLLGWIPDRDAVYFSSEATGSRAEWVLDVVDGKPVGLPRLVSRALGNATPVGFADDGRFFYVVGGRTSADLHYGHLDIDTGELIGTTRDVNPSHVGGSLPLWSQDGRVLTYIAPRGRNAAYSRKELAVFDVESGLIHTVLPRVFHNSGSGFLVSPDAREIIMLGRDLEDRLGLFAINRDSGEVRRLVASETPDEIGLDFEWPSRDGPIYYQERKSTRQRIIGLDPESLERETIYETSPGDPVVGRFSVSHDGGWFAFVESRYAPGQTPSTTHFLRVLRRDNPVSEQFELPGSVSHPGLAWSEDDSVVAFILDRRIWKEVEGRMESERAGEEYWRVPMDGGAPIVTALSLPEGYRAHGIHLETGRISVYVGGEQTPRELWVLENFLPPEK